MRSPKPNAIAIVPSVTMIGGSRSRVITTPLNSPHARPERMQTRIPTAMPSVACGYWPLITWSRDPESVSITSPPATPAKKRIAPIDRSMPAVTMTNVSPIASRTTSEVVSAICERFDQVRNVPGGVESQK